MRESERIDVLIKAYKIRRSVDAVNIYPPALASNTRREKRVKRIEAALKTLPLLRDRIENGELLPEVLVIHSKKSGRSSQETYDEAEMLDSVMEFVLASMKEELVSELSELMTPQWSR